MKAGTHSAFGEKSHTTAYTPKQGRFGRGWYHYPRSVPHVSETLRGQGVERQTLPILGLGRGGSRRTQKAFGTAMRLCVSLSRRRRGPAGLRNSTCLYGCKRQRNYQANINITPADKIDTAEGVYKTRPFSQYRQLRVIINLCRGGIMYREFIL